MNFPLNNTKYLLLAVTICLNAVAKERPNIIFLLTDDQRDGTFGAMGHSFVQTPHVDKLIEGGVRFSNTYIATAVCAQSRISLFTGLPERVHGVGFSSAYKLTGKQWEQSYPALVRKAGYHTGFIGKFGVLYHTFKAEQEFDFWYGHHGWTRFLPMNHDHKDTTPYHGAKTMNKVAKTIRRTVAAATLLATALILGACASATQRGYKALVLDLDSGSEIRISTYPAWYPSTKKEVPYAYTHRETHDEVYLQINIKEKGKKRRPNETADSVLIKSFSYQLDDGESQELITNYQGYFWMQDNPNYNKRKLAPVPYESDSVLSVKIELSLNGNDYSLEGEMPASERTMVYPLVFDAKSP